MAMVCWGYERFKDTRRSSVIVRVFGKFRDTIMRHFVSDGFGLVHMKDAERLVERAITGVGACLPIKLTKAVRTLGQPTPPVREQELRHTGVTKTESLKNYAGTTKRKQITDRFIEA